jgi:dCMP deaminase
MNTTTRPTVDQTFMEIAHLWSLRSTCTRAQVGAVLARDGRAISSGYNGAPPGMRHCQHDGVIDPADTCTRASHAERNAIAFAARYGVSTDKTTLYVTHSPCVACGLEVISAGITRVVYAIPYRVTEPAYSGLPMLAEAGIWIEQQYTEGQWD